MYKKNRLRNLTQAIFLILLCVNILDGKCGALFLCSGCVVAVAAERFVDVCLTEHHKLVAL